jgi:hypothetical protein
MISRRSLVTPIAATATTPLVPRTAGAAEKWSHAIATRRSASRPRSTTSARARATPSPNDEIVNGRMVSLNMEVPRDKIAWMQDMMIRVKQQEKPVDIDRLIDTRLRDQALELVGRR